MSSPADALHDGDSALLSELLSLIDGDGDVKHEPPNEPHTTARRKTVKELTGRKREIARLRDEAGRLTEQLMRMRGAEPEGSVQAKETALSERRKRQRAESECVALREAVFHQKQFIRGLRSVFSVTQRLSLGLDLCRYLHHQTRLPRNGSDRWRKFNRTIQDKRIASAVDVLCRETSAISLQDGVDADTPFVHCELIDEANTRSTTYTTMYTIDTQDVAAVVRAVCVAIRDVVTICPSGHPLHVLRDTVDEYAPADYNILYRVMRIGHQCEATGEQIEVASRIVTSYKITDDFGVVLWDFVDDDELHPSTESLNLTRETTGACLVRLEQCDDGVERVVFRSLGTKKFRFQNQQSVEKHRRIGCIVQADAMVRGDELLFRRLVLEQIAAEQGLELQVAQV